VHTIHKAYFSAVQAFLKIKSSVLSVLFR
jgi:hypothetical protein